MSRAIILLLLILHAAAGSTMAQPFILRAASFKHYIDRFNANDEELYKGAIPNADSWQFLAQNIPLLDCPDNDLQETYYFRWWTYRKHIALIPHGHIITEFLPHVPWAGKYNGISCAAGLHFSEGRWLHTKKYLDDYADYWFHGGGDPRAYSFWAADAVYNYCLIGNDFGLAKKLLPDLIRNYEHWETSNLDSIGLFWQVDDRDGMEMSVCGEDVHGIGYRPTINAYLYGDAKAIAKICRLSGRESLASEFEERARLIKAHVQQKLWDANSNFFKVLTRGPSASFCTSRELIGYTPWYFNMPGPAYSKAWKFLMDSTYFYAPFGPTTVERRAPGFSISYAGHECQWNGPSWPYATSITLTALANLLNNYDQHIISDTQYMSLLKVYARSHRRTAEDGKTIPWIDENLNPFTGDWISRTRLKTWKNGTWSAAAGGKERGKDYNHSLFCDLIISGLIGIRPAEGPDLEIHPLVPPGYWDYFCFDNLLYHGKIITVLYDRSGRRYQRGKGFFVFVNGKCAASLPEPRKVVVRLSETPSETVTTSVR